MTYHLEIKEEASDEISDAFTWYEDHKEGLGSEFIVLLEEYFERITKKPMLYPTNGKERVAFMDRFPYKIVFGIEKKSVVVYAIFHTSRDPKKLER
ncbi:MAG TPA: type II toxin-antitoxin system RelE/ParE family toxin [Fulvivirga sp.]|nr:type II toxin-antitoxin system RelE/ParE family toxin [Fulvivirga sp.]